MVFMRRVDATIRPKSARIKATFFPFKNSRGTNRYKLIYTAGIKTKTLIATIFKLKIEVSGFKRIPCLNIHSYKRKSTHAVT
jgi:hypothetical protein